MKKIFILAALLSLIFILEGCAAQQYAGVAKYSIKPFTDEKTGQTLCCEVLVISGKEIAHISTSIIKNSDGYEFRLYEDGVQAFQGQAISTEALGKIPSITSPIIPFLF